MAKVGFHSTPEQASQIEHTLDTIEKTIQTEIYQLNNYEGQIRRQLKEVSDLQHNFTHTEHLVNSLYKLNTNREELIQKIRFLKAKRPSEIDVEKIYTLFEIINRLDKEMSPMIYRANQEIQRLIIEETHLLYAADRQTKAIMDTINDEARNLQINIKSIETQYNAVYQELQQISKEIGQIRQERIQDQTPKTPHKPGF